MTVSSTKFDLLSGYYSALDWSEFERSKVLLHEAT
jgi:hypothetical protein